MPLSPAKGKQSLVGFFWRFLPEPRWHYFVYYDASFYWRDYFIATLPSFMRIISFSLFHIRAAFSPLYVAFHFAADTLYEYISDISPTNSVFRICAHKAFHTSRDSNDMPDASLMPIYGFHLRDDISFRAYNAKLESFPYMPFIFSRFRLFYFSSHYFHSWRSAFFASRHIHYFFLYAGDIETSAVYGIGIRLPFVLDISWWGSQDVRIAILKHWYF